MFELEELFQDHPVWVSWLDYPAHIPPQSPARPTQISVGPGWKEEDGEPVISTRR